MTEPYEQIEGTERENQERIRNVERAMERYAAGEHCETALVDILTDLRHWAAMKGVSFECANEVAADHYAAEGPCSCARCGERVEDSEFNERRLCLECERDWTELPALEAMERLLMAKDSVVEAKAKMDALFAEFVSGGGR